MKQPAQNRILLFAVILLSAVCWYLGFGLTGKFWFLLWVAPIPVLLYSLQLRAKPAFVLSFTAYFIGRISWLPFLISVAGLPVALIFTISLSLIFALIILLSRTIILRSGKWWNIFVLPSAWTAFEFLLMRFSPDGSAGSVAYSQSDFLPLVQIASVTGIAGITFTITFFPSVIAITARFLKKNNPQWKHALSCLPLILLLLVFGYSRLRNKQGETYLTIGGAVLAEKFHHITDSARVNEETETAELYALEVKKLAGAGAKIIVLPERGINLSPQTEAEVMQIYEQAARESNVKIIAGYTNFLSKPDRNSAFCLDESGHQEFNYHKVKLVTGLESQFTPGKDPGIFSYHNVPAGIAICKDLDFPAYIQKYGKKEVNFLCIPAWDFRVDGWLHARMAVLRGVENGFGEIRSAREGRLTISDCYGRIIAEASSEKGNAASVIGDFPLQKVSTIYQQTGDWFGFMNLIALFIFLVFAVFFRRRSSSGTYA